MKVSTINLMIFIVVQLTLSNYTKPSVISLVTITKRGLLKVSIISTTTYKPAQDRIVVRILKLEK